MGDFTKSWQAYTKQCNSCTKSNENINQEQLIIYDANENSHVFKWINECYPVQDAFASLTNKEQVNLTYLRGYPDLVIDMKKKAIQGQQSKLFRGATVPKLLFTDSTRKKCQTHFQSKLHTIQGHLATCWNADIAMEFLNKCWEYKIKRYSRIYGEHM
jgi:hypothetical protein